MTVYLISHSQIHTKGGLIINQHGGGGGMGEVSITCYDHQDGGRGGCPLLFMIIKMRASLTFYDIDLANFASFNIVIIRGSLTFYDDKTC